MAKIGVWDITFALAAATITVADAQEAEEQHDQGNEEQNEHIDHEANIQPLQQTGELYQCRATQLKPKFDLLRVGETTAMDIEFQEYKHDTDNKWHHCVGRIAIVNTVGQFILDVYAAYPKDVNIRKKMPPAVFGVTWKDLLYDNGAVSALKVEQWVKKIVTGRKVVLHGGRLDLLAFMLIDDVWEGSERIIDSQRLYANHHGGRHWQVSLSTLAADILDRNIHNAGHSPVEDAIATMDLYLLRYPGDRMERRARRNQHIHGNNGNGTGNDRWRRNNWA